MSNHVLSRIIDNVKTLGIYSDIVYETQELNRHAQVSIVLR